MSDTGPTYTEQALAKRRLTLLRNAGTAQQRAVRVIDSDRLDHRAAALAYATTHYPGQPLTWLHHDTKAQVQA